jgi:hypothetical protein
MSQNKIQAEVTIRGERPLLWHRFTAEALSSERAERKGTAGNDPDEWRKTVMIIGDKNQLFLDPSYIFAAFREGAKFTRKSRTSLQAMLSATLQVTDTHIVIKDRFLPDGLTTPPQTDPMSPVYLDVRGVRNPVTRGRNIRYRIACSSGWECSFHLVWDPSILNRDQMHAIAIDAGRLVGIGSGRNIGFGRFEVTSFEVAE